MSVTCPTLFIVNEAPYGDERPYNALRLALHLGQRQATAVRLFLTGDGVLCARRGQQPSSATYNLEAMLRAVAECGEVAT